MINLDQFAGHTPGPWKYDDKHWGLITGNEETIVDDGDVQTNNQNDCFLIAAAPALLAELRQTKARAEAFEAKVRELRDVVGDAYYAYVKDEYGELHEILSKALAKLAEGDQSGHPHELVKNDHVADASKKAEGERDLHGTV